MDVTIRHAVEADLPQIVDIYNQSIPAGRSTADTLPIAVSDRIEWFKKHNPERRPLYVAIDVSGEMVGWVGLTSFVGGRPAYDATAEISTYIATKAQRQGLGRRLKEYMISQCPRLGVTTLLSLYFDHNPATTALNAELGFELAGHLKDIAVINGESHGLMIGLLRVPGPKKA
ncbi:MAG: GNAT family N-acetyltransferase [Fimbriiglobus sp.]